jgi:hypothetical protein
MKKTILGIATVIAAVAASAFTTLPSHKAFTSYTFQYVGPDYTQTNVQDNSNWEYVAGTGRCSDAPTGKACRIYVNSNDITPDGSSYDLKSSFSISGHTGTPSYVTSTTDGSGLSAISNQNN